MDNFGFTDKDCEILNGKYLHFNKLKELKNFDIVGINEECFECRNIKTGELKKIDFDKVNETPAFEDVFAKHIKMFDTQTPSNISLISVNANNVIALQKAMGVKFLNLNYTKKISLIHVMQLLD